MAEYISLITEELGISVGFLTILFVWSFVWMLLALWKAAKKGSVAWFIILAIINTVGILPILYIFVFSKMKKKPSKKKTSKKKSTKKSSKKK